MRTAASKVAKALLPRTKSARRLAAEAEGRLPPSSTRDPKIEDGSPKDGPAQEEEGLGQKEEGQKQDPPTTDRNSRNSPFLRNFHSLGLLGARFRNHVKNQFQQHFRPFSTRKNQSPRIFKLCLMPRPGKPGILTIHNLCVQTERDKKYFDDPRRPGIEEYTVESEQAMGEDLIKRLGEVWVNYEKDTTDLKFRKQMWDKHGKNSGLSMKAYFTLAVQLFDRVSDAIDFSSISKNQDKAMLLSMNIHLGLEQKYEHPNAEAFPEIVCFDADAENRAALKELRMLFRSEEPYLPFDCKRCFVNCQHNTRVIF